MSDLHMDIAPPDVALGQIYKGVIAVPPINFTAPIGVVMPDIHPDLVFHCKWQARDNMSFPQVEDDVLIIWDNENEPWVVTWWPDTRNPSISTGNYSDGPPADAVQDDIWIAYNVNATAVRLAFQYDANANKWQPISLVPNPPVNGSWVYGQGGAAIWKTIAQDDLPDTLKRYPPATFSDCNACTVTGWYSCTGNAINTPGGNNGYGYLKVQAFSSGDVFQQFYAWNGDVEYQRRKTSGNWGSWQQLRSGGLGGVAWYGPYTIGPVTASQNTYVHTWVVHNLNKPFSTILINGWIEDRSYGINYNWSVNSGSDNNQIGIFLNVVGGAGGGQNCICVWHGYFGVPLT